MKLLNEIQQKLKAPKGQKNTFGNYNYRSCEDILEAVKPLIGDKGFLLLGDEIVTFGNRFYVKATASLHEIVTKEQVSVVAYAREAETKKGMDESQITGASSSYARKYALNGLFCIDDTKDADTEKPPADEKPKASKPEPKTPLEITNQAFVLWQTKYPKSKKTFKQFQADVIKQFKKLPTNKASVQLIIDTIKPDEEDGLMGIDEVTPAPSKGWECASCGERYLVKPKTGICEKCEGFLNELQ